MHHPFSGTNAQGIQMATTALPQSGAATYFDIRSTTQWYCGEFPYSFQIACDILLQITSNSVEKVLQMELDRDMLSPRPKLSLGDSTQIHFTRQDASARCDGPIKSLQGAVNW